jgi:hypothetical protein
MDNPSLELVRESLACRNRPLVLGRDNPFENNRFDPKSAPSLWVASRDCETTLMDLEKAGLVRVERRGKRSPIVIILAKEDRDSPQRE